MIIRERNEDGSFKKVLTDTTVRVCVEKIKAEEMTIEEVPTEIVKKVEKLFNQES